MKHTDIEHEVRLWLEQVVIGLNLCPFASKPYLQNQVRIVISDCEEPTCLLTQLAEELQFLDKHEPQQLETTLLVLPQMLENFYDYNAFLDMADALLEQLGWTGFYQIASFHPHYQFSGTQPEDAENLTNCSPYPILHLIREASIEKVLKHYPNPTAIPQRNIDTVCNLTKTQIRQLFPHLNSSD
ncbi:MAG: DUF1415 domain-containing protein [Thiomicrorhabdus chilensis]|uniref:DUF1415 domain-containing protein n=1 Tax=Thiomicrorhabdus chilensis TaxID=63656 RepID=UPI00299E0316|nr:DUF1415 domain-containing protein [Thiomicrorhabdus chilensis]MDX1348394.1 DUF1415 domain-containing protein [Thiomicrorhabdus chilensis]